MGQASSSTGGDDNGRTPAATAVAAQGQATRFLVQPLTPILKAVRSPTVWSTGNYHPRKLRYSSTCVQKGATLVLEVDALGFRLLKPKTFDAINAFGWGEIHSWMHSPRRFSFRFYEEK